MDTKVEPWEPSGKGNPFVEYATTNVSLNGFAGFMVGRNGEQASYSTPTGAGSTVGGSAPIPIAGVPVQIGADYITAYDKNGKLIGEGSALSIGKASIPEIHAYETYTQSAFDFIDAPPINFFENWDNFYNWLEVNDFNQIG